MKTPGPSRQWIERGVVAAAAAVVTLLMAMSAAAAPGDATRIAAVFPPWWSSAQATGAAASAGEIAGAGAFRSILIVSSRDTGLSARLRSAGAVILLSPGLAGLCDVPASEVRT